MLYDFTSVREKFPWRKDLLNKDAICLQANQEKTKSGKTNCPLIFWVFHVWHHSWYSTTYLIWHLQMWENVQKIVLIWSTWNKHEGIKSRDIYLLWWTNHKINTSTMEHRFSTTGKKLSGKFDQSANPGLSRGWAVPSHLRHMVIKIHGNCKFQYHTWKETKQIFPKNL